uniref:Acetyl-coenzyme A carboxylase carboxyl transferase subunit beta, chloroplastic n=1 Tax=Campylosiphon championii TaxID=1861789 RepID=A0A2H4EC19_9LILI|nr:acetyl-CoA carboxylase carboxyltransferase beta [Burmannia championii]ANK36279.1 acetyl-CoA carboxylase carboxyltransferase beta [Burmannia championii]
MEKWWFNCMLSKKKLEDRCGLNKLMNNLGCIGDNSGGKDSDMEKNILNWGGSGSYVFSNVDSLFEIKKIWDFIYDDTFLVRDNNGNSYSVYFDIENNIIEIDNDHFFMSELESFFSRYLNSVSNTKNNNNLYYYYMDNNRSCWNNHINNCIDSYLCFEINRYSFILGDTDNYSNSYIYNFICTHHQISIRGSESGSFSIRNNSNGSNFNIRLKSNDFDINKKYRNLWVQCENCYGLNYKKFFRSKMNICEHCGYHLKMSSSDRIELLIDQGTWDPMDENMVSMDPIDFHSEEEPYRDRIYSYQKKTGLTEAIQTGIGQLNGIPVAIGVMDFQFMGGSMGSVVGEKITRLIESATKRSLPVIIVCASGGARMQEGSLSLMQMAKISSVSYDYQSNKKLFYVSILTSPTTGGVTASFGMLGDIIIAEPNAYIAFAGKRVIEQTLNKTVPDGSQASEYLFHKGLFDSIVPRNLLKGVLSELFHLHGFFPLNL